MGKFEDILKKYWGFDTFRSLQDQIIQSVADKKDTLGLMPTGGGKSITFQVPAMALDGICLVITPLIALMKDQVENLKSKQIKAIAIHSGLSSQEIDIALDNCVYGDIKFLYLSPERISTELFQSRVQQMSVNLIAVDEAHCISQWGYDFRPSYLKIAELRTLLPNVPILALTATATPEVVKDIQNKLHFKTENLFQKSFERDNLVYVVRPTEDKLTELFKISKKLSGTGIIYVRNRKKTKEIAYELKKKGESADFYHAGLSYEVRMEKQEAWKKNEIRIMVTTNAFGMGIDKPDVRFVIHIEFPDSIEEYFQEAGRAGRDEKKAYAILLNHASDINTMNQRVVNNFPELTKIRTIYSALYSYFKIPYGSGKGISVDFDLVSFCKEFHFNFNEVFAAIKILELEGYLESTDDLHIPSRVHFLIDRDDLYKFQVANEAFDGFIKLLLRNYAGLFSDYVSIYESDLAKKSGVSIEVIWSYLNKLSASKIISYIPQRNKPLIVFEEERLEERSVYISKENYQTRKERYNNKVKAMLNYATESEICRSVLLLRYFGETHGKPCGKCDVCLTKTEKGLTRFETDQIIEEIKLNLSKGKMDINVLLKELHFEESKSVEVLRDLLDKQIIIRNDIDELSLKD